MRQLVPIGRDAAFRSQYKHEYINRLLFTVNSHEKQEKKNV